MRVHLCLLLVVIDRTLRTYKAQHFGREAQSLLLVVDVHAGQFDLHWFLPIVTFADDRAADPESRAG